MQGGHPTRLTLSGTCVFAPHSEVRELEYFAKTSAPSLGPDRAAALHSPAEEREDRQGPAPLCREPEAEAAHRCGPRSTGARPQLGAHPPRVFPPRCVLSATLKGRRQGG